MKNSRAPPPLPGPASGTSSAAKEPGKLRNYQPIRPSFLYRTSGASSKTNNDIVVLEQALSRTPKPSPLPRHLAPPLTSMRACLLQRLPAEQRKAFDKEFPANPNPVVVTHSSSIGDDNFKHDTCQLHKKN